MSQCRTYYWPTTFPDAPTYPALKEDLSCDVFIIGGGSSGAQCAYYLADTNLIIEELFKSSQIGSVNNLLRQLMYNDQEYPEELPDTIEFWLKETASCPKGVDMARIKNATDLFREHGISIGEND